MDPTQSEPQSSAIPSPVRSSRGLVFGRDVMCLTCRGIGKVPTYTGGLTPRTHRPMRTFGDCPVCGGSGYYVRKGDGIDRV